MWTYIYYIYILLSIDNKHFCTHTHTHTHNTFTQPLTLYLNYIFTTNSLLLTETCHSYESTTWYNKLRRLR